MDPIKILRLVGTGKLTAEEEALLERELASAYHQDEASSGSREVQRIAEKVRARLGAANDAPTTDSTTEKAP